MLVLMIPKIDFIERLSAVKLKLFLDYFQTATYTVSVMPTNFSGVEKYLRFYLSYIF